MIAKPKHMVKFPIFAIKFLSYAKQEIQNSRYSIEFE